MIIKKLFWLVSAVCLLACSQQSSEPYYRTRPQFLDKAMKQCPEHSPRGISCAQLSQISAHVNSLIFELQINPQQFGSQILRLQEQVGVLKKRVQEKPTEQQWQTELQQSEQQLAERMAIVGWLESPEG